MVRYTIGVEIECNNLNIGQVVECHKAGINRVSKTGIVIPEYGIYRDESVDYEIISPVFNNVIDCIRYVRGVSKCMCEYYSDVYNLYRNAGLHVNLWSNNLREDMITHPEKYYVLQGILSIIDYHPIVYSRGIILFTPYYSVNEVIRECRYKFKTIRQKPYAIEYRLINPPVNMDITTISILNVVTLGLSSKYYVFREVCNSVPWGNITESILQSNSDVLYLDREVYNCVKYIIDQHRSEYKLMGKTIDINLRDETIRLIGCNRWDYRIKGSYRL